MSKITVLVDNLTCGNLTTEHGLALLVECQSGRFLFDTGAGQALLPNLTALGIAAASLERVVISHGHYDHTGGLADLLAAASGVMPEIYAASGIDQQRFSIHPDRPLKDVSMPATARKTWQKAGRRQVIDDFTEIAVGVFLTGPIPRFSGEDCGGPFFLDAAGQQPDLLLDEQAMLLADGTLIQGCCHSGIINTLQHCHRMAPQITVRTIIGGLHLHNASFGRLQRTAEYLRTLPLQRLILLHCTGEHAIAYLRQQLSCPVVTGCSGAVYEC